MIARIAQYTMTTRRQCKYSSMLFAAVKLTSFFVVGACNVNATHRARQRNDAYFCFILQYILQCLIDQRIWVNICAAKKKRL